jgi:hypothetical protein
VRRITGTIGATLAIMAVAVSATPAEESSASQGPNEHEESHEFALAASVDLGFRVGQDVGFDIVGEEPNLAGWGPTRDPAEPNDQIVWSE